MEDHNNQYPPSLHPQPDFHQHHEFLLHVPRHVGRKPGVRNYCDSSLFQLVQKVLPASHDEWKMVAEEYQSIRNDPCPHKAKNIKRHFLQKAFGKNDLTACILQNQIACKSSNNTQDSENAIKRQRTISMSQDEVDKAIEHQGSISPLSEHSFQQSADGEEDIHPGILDPTNISSPPPR